MPIEQCIQNPKKSSFALFSFPFFLNEECFKSNMQNYGLVCNKLMIKKSFGSNDNHTMHKPLETQKF